MDIVLSNTWIPIQVAKSVFRIEYGYNFSDLDFGDFLKLVIRALPFVLGKYTGLETFF